MRFLCFLGVIFLHSISIAQPVDTTKWLRAFPITDYIIDANDSIKIVQVQLPDGVSIKEKTFGVLYGTYKTSREDAVELGTGRCQLIKGDYYYFGIHKTNKELAIKPGNILYVMVPPANIHYGYITKLARHFIQLKTVEDSALYNRYNVFVFWNAEKEAACLKEMVDDIQFTGKYFKEENPEADVLIKSGNSKGSSTFSKMITCDTKLLTDFLEYVIARPRNYAGGNWKIAEIFATWISEGAPSIIKK